MDVDAVISSHIESARAIIQKAERDLGKLSNNQKIDLLLDNLDYLQGSAHAKELLQAVKEAA